MIHIYVTEFREHVKNKFGICKKDFKEGAGVKGESNGKYLSIIEISIVKMCSDNNE